jgi:hypothetical protein
VCRPMRAKQGGLFVRCDGIAARQSLRAARRNVVPEASADIGAPREKEV